MKKLWRRKVQDFKKLNFERNREIREIGWERGLIQPTTLFL